MSTLDVFARATFSMIRGYECPYSWFSLASMHIPGSALSVVVSDYPSWVCDLSITSWTLSIQGVYTPGALVAKYVDELMLVFGLTDLHPCSRVSPDYKQSTTVGSYMGTVAETTGDLLHINTEVLNEWDTIPATAMYKMYNGIVRARGISVKKLIHAISRNMLYGVKDVETLDRILRERIESPDDPRVDEGSPCFEVLRDLREAESHIMFVTEEGDVGITNHTDVANGVRPGDIVVGLFGINYPFIRRLVPGAAKDKLMYTMINVAHVADHVWGYDFVQEAVEKVENDEEPPPWSGFERFGSKEYTVV